MAVNPSLARGLLGSGVLPADESIVASLSQASLLERANYNLALSLVDYDKILRRDDQLRESSSDVEAAFKGLRDSLSASKKAHVKDKGEMEGPTSKADQDKKDALKADEDAAKATTNAERKY